ncbi:MAG: ABC transporter substrate-binding protein, partial [Oscillospiraceae bacterium]
MKKLLSLILVAAMAIGMTACSSGGTSSTAAESKPAEDKPTVESTAEAEPGKLVEISLPTYTAGENVGAVFFLPHIERFNKKFEGKYKINIEEVPQASYSEKIKQLAQQKKLPPLIHAGVDNEWFKSVAIPNGYAYDLTEWYQSSPSKGFFIQDSVDYSTRDGKLITVPQAVTRPIGLYYNSAVYTPGKAIHEMTLDEFITSIGENKIAMQTADNGWCSALMLSA